MKPTLIEEYCERNYFENNRYVLETKIWLLSDPRYPSGVKFSLIFIDTKTMRKVLYDNHHPKGPHIHINDNEIPYVYIDEKTLMANFRSQVLQHFGVTI